MIYYLSFTTGEIRRIRYNGPSPTAAATPTQRILAALGLPSPAPARSTRGGGSLTYLWDFGDGTTSTAGQSVAHLHERRPSRTFTARLTVTNQSGVSSTDTVAP